MKSMEEMIKAAQQAAETIQKQMTETQGKLDAIEVEGIAGGGLVSVVVNGHKQLVSVKIKKEAVDPEDVETLEDLVFAAAQSALSAAEARNNEVMEAVQSASMPTGIGGMFGM